MIRMSILCPITDLEIVPVFSSINSRDTKLVINRARKGIMGLYRVVVVGGQCSNGFYNRKHITDQVSMRHNGTK
jgi:hypothetical protein